LKAHQVNQINQVNQLNFKLIDIFVASFFFFEEEEEDMFVCWASNFFTYILAAQRS